jgi:hypothetical protein
MRTSQIRFRLRCKVSEFLHHMIILIPVGIGFGVLFLFFDWIETKMEDHP